MELYFSRRDDLLTCSTAPDAFKVTKPSLPPCSRSLLLQLTGKRGFASEYTRFLRAAAAGRHYGYEVVVDSESKEGRWVYGELSE